MGAVMCRSSSPLRHRCLSGLSPSSAAGALISGPHWELGQHSREAGNCVSFSIFLSPEHKLQHCSTCSKMNRITNLEETGVSMMEALPSCKWTCCSVFCRRIFSSLFSAVSPAVSLCISIMEGIMVSYMEWTSIENQHGNRRYKAKTLTAHSKKKN